MQTPGLAELISSRVFMENVVWLMVLWHLHTVPSLAYLQINYEDTKQPNNQVLVQFVTLVTAQIFSNSSFS
jgi:hypothetical protein